MTPRPILIHRVIARLNVGGPAMHVVNLTRALNRGPFHTRLIAGRVSPTEGDMGYYAAERGVEVTFLPELSREIDSADDVRALWRLYRLFRKERPDVVHTHTAKAGTLGRVAALLAGVPVRVHTYHGHVLGGSYFSAFKTRVFLEIERQLARVSTPVVLTRRQADEMSGRLGVAPRERFAVIPLGLDLDRFVDALRAPLRARTRAVLGIGQDALVVGIVGRMVPVKNHELFFRAVARLAGTTRRPVVAMVVGSGEREVELRAYAADLGLQDAATDGARLIHDARSPARVLWLGWRQDLPALYAAMDVLALTSHDEGTPVAVIEALASGTPVVARDVGGVGEVLEECGVGALVSGAAGPDAWARALADGAVTHDVDATVRRAVAQRFSVERLAGDMARLYRREQRRVRPA